MSKIKYLFYGIVSASGATVFQQIFLILTDVSAIETDKMTALLFFGALSEEIFKFIFLYRLRLEDPSENFFCNSFFLGAGFSFLEISFKLWSGTADATGLCGIVLLHTLAAGMMGYFLNKKGSVLWLVLGFFSALALHLGYNLYVIYLY